MKFQCTGNYSGDTFTLSKAELIEHIKDEEDAEVIAENLQLLRAATLNVPFNLGFMTAVMIEE